MKVLFLDQFSDLGGAQNALLAALEAACDSGWQALVGMPGAGPLARRIQAIGFDTVELPCGPYGLAGKSAADLVRFTRQTPGLVRAIRDAARSIGAELVFINGPRLLPAAALAGLDVPTLFYSHNYLPHGPVRKMSGLALRRLGSSVVGCCRFVARCWEPFVPSTRLSLIFNGVPGPPAPVVRSMSSAPKIGCIGRISPEKGQLAFLEAARIIHQAVPASRFAVYGAPMFSSAAADYDREVRGAARGLPVEFPGWTDDVYAALSQLDLLLVPSAAQEATPRIILEAFSAGVPVIAFRSGGIPEIVEDGRTGFLVDSVEEMAERTVASLRSHRGKLETVARAAQQSWRERFTLECFQRQLVAAMVAVRSSAYSTNASAPTKELRQPCGAGNRRAGGRA